MSNIFPLQTSPIDDSFKFRPNPPCGIDNSKPRLKLVSPPPIQDTVKFAVDIDSTLYDFSSPAREAFLKLYEDTEDRTYLRGAYSAWVEWRTPADVCGLETWLEVISMCHSPEVVLKQMSYAGAVDTLQALVNEGHELMYISNRNTEAAEATRQWIRNEGFPCEDHVEVHCMMEDKAPYLAECQYLIDDRPKTMIEFVYDSSWDKSRGKRKALSLLYEYNRALTDIPDIFLSPTWAGLASWLERKKLISEVPYLPLQP